MTEHLQLIQKKLNHLERMKGYLMWSHEQVKQFLPIQDWSTLTPEQHESLAAFRVRFGEFQEHMGKTMRAIAIEEEKQPEPFGNVLAYMEKLNIIDGVEHWKIIRELRNAVNHEYEDNESRLSQFFEGIFSETPSLVSYYEQMAEFCRKQYGI